MRTTIANIGSVVTGDWRDPTESADEDFPRHVNESEIAMQMCTTGNLRATLLYAKWREHSTRFNREPAMPR